MPLSARRHLLPALGSNTEPRWGRERWGHGRVRMRGELDATKQVRCPTGKRHCRQKPCLMAPIDIQHAPLSHICQHPIAASEGCSSSQARTSVMYTRHPHQDRKRLTGSLLRSSRAGCQRQGETCQPWRQTQPQTPVHREGRAMLNCHVSPVRVQYRCKLTSDAGAGTHR